MVTSPTAGPTEGEEGLLDCLPSFSVPWCRCKDGSHMSFLRSPVVCVSIIKSCDPFDQSSPPYPLERGILYTRRICSVFLMISLISDPRKARVPFSTYFFRLVNKRECAVKVECTLCTHTSDRRMLTLILNRIFQINLELQMLIILGFLFTVVGKAAGEPRQIFPQDFYGIKAHSSSPGDSSNLDNSRNPFDGPVRGSFAPFKSANRISILNSNLSDAGMDLRSLFYRVNATAYRQYGLGNKAIPQKCWYKSIQYRCALSVTCVFQGSKPIDLCNGGMIWSCCVPRANYDKVDQTLGAIADDPDVKEEFIQRHRVLKIHLEEARG